MFKIQSLSLEGHSNFNTIDIDFVPENELGNGPYTTLIIGPNGTGKSHILSAVVEIIVFLQQLKDGYLKKKIRYNFKILFKYKRSKFKASYSGGEMVIYKNNKLANISDLILPKKILASAININDRFPNLMISNDNGEDVYKYLGIRSTSNAAYISVHVKSIIESLAKAANNLLKIRNVSQLFTSLDLAPIIGLRYKAGERLTLEALKKSSFSEEVHFDAYYSQFIDKELTRYSGRNSRRAKRYDKILSDDLVRLRVVDFISKNIGVLKRGHLKEFTWAIKLDFNSQQSISDFIEKAEMIVILVELDILSVDSIELFKYDSAFRFEHASSGEYHLLTSFLGLIANMEDDSVILIDEPEISLHPNWQLKYMSILKSVFESYKSCHFIIASHSHFLVSDLKADTSCVVSLKSDKNTGKVYAQLRNEDTFSWSAEQILLEIFEVPTTRNYYVSTIVSEILELMANPESENQVITKKIKALRDMNINNLKKEDPLKDIISALLKKIQ
jgi:predicted ATPase